jgi:thioredoxin reductase
VLPKRPESLFPIFAICQENVMLINPVCFVLWRSTAKWHGPAQQVKASTMQTSLHGIYAGGEVTSGPRSVIQAVNAGRKAAEAIHRQFGKAETE